MAINMCVSQSMLDNMSVERFYAQRDNLDLNFYLQRNEVWSTYKKSKLITSLLLNFPVPTLVAHREDNGKLTILDGLQRSLSIIKFINNEYAISEGIDDIIMKDLVTGDNITYHITGKLYKDFDDKLKNYLLTRIIKVEICSGLTEQYKSEILLRLNEGMNMGGIDKVRATTYGTLLPIVLEVKESDLFNRKVKITKSSKARFHLDEKLIYSIIAYESNVPVTDNIESMTTKILNSGSFDDKAKQRMNKILDYINLSYPVETKHLNITNFIPIYAIAKKHMKKVDGRKFYSIMCNIFKDIDESYEKVTGNWNSTSALNKRIEVLGQLFDNLAKR